MKFRTYTGKMIDLQNITVDDIELEDIAHSLSRICRYNGHIEGFWSVAQHSIVVFRKMPSKAPDAAKLWALLHDASEAYIGDITRPMRKILSGLDEVEARINKAIFEKFKLYDLSLRDMSAVNNVDDYVLKLEMDDELDDDFEDELDIDHIEKMFYETAIEYINKINPNKAA